MRDKKVSETSAAKESVGAHKNLSTILFLLFNSLSWYYMTWRIIYGVMRSPSATYLEDLLILGANNSAIIGSGVAGSILSHKVKRLEFIRLWILLGTVTSLVPSVLPNMTLECVLIFSLLSGVSFGLGMPSCLAYFADGTIFENRGLMSGIVFLATFLSTPIMIVMLSKVNLVMGALISTIWRGLGLAVLLLAKPSEILALEERKHISFASIAANRSFLLYLIPWLMFSVIDGFEKIVFENFLGSDVLDSLRVIGSIMGTISAFAGGFMSDLVGRKRVVISGFVSLGLAYAAIGIAPTSAVSWYFYSVIDGIAWGVFTVSFFLVLWGDLSSDSASEKYYAIGSIPFFLAELMGFLFAPLASIPANAAFSVASLFLFMAVLPLMYAPETMPERKIEFRRLRKYVEKAKKIREKYMEKGTKG